MGTKRSIITTGSYDSYHIIAVVEGPQSPAIGTLWKRFKELYNYPEYMNHYMPDRIYEYFSRLMESQDKMIADGLGDERETAQLFVNWLVNKHNFTLVKMNELNIY